MTIQDRIDAFLKHNEKSRAISYAQSLISFDAATGAPKAAVDDRAEILGYFALEGFLHNTSSEYDEILTNLEAVYTDLTPEMQRIVHESRKDLNKVKKIPPNEFKEYSIIIAKSESAWEEAKETSNFSVFAPYLEKIVDFTRKFVGYFGVIDGHPYNTLLDDYEEGLTIDQLNEFFYTLKARIVPTYAVVM
jgi:carboxypeptidase Taq